ncbi:MAG TPA: SDR family NAD(P)-dependent oxidoreductase [Candidatus Tectomicrobia bacterium]|nr:SDR family NAD(P)-dependent oxidoreductase [Candidatus Tectomicrobia bacterium]
MRLATAVVVVTGAGGGIGRAIARAFAQEGAGLVLGDLGEPVQRVAEEVRGGGGRAVACHADVTSFADMGALVATAERELGGVDVLVTCAGLGLSGLLVEQPEDEWTRVVEVNLNGTYRAIRAALPAMMRRGAGRIVTIASVLGKVGGSGFVSAYVASKHGVIGLTRALAAELGSQGYPGITVNAICPGYTRAGMGIAVQSTKAGPMSGEEIFDRWYRRQVPQRRMMEAEEIAHVAVFLSLPASAGITGQAINVDGGFVMS